MKGSYINRLYEHVWWADAEAGKALMAMSSPPSEFVELYAHILGAELIWLDRIEGQKRSLAVWPDATIEACLQLAQLPDA